MKVGCLDNDEKNSPSTFLLFLAISWNRKRAQRMRLWSCIEQSKKVVTNMIMVTPEAFPVTVLNSVISLQKKLIKPENYYRVRDVRCPKSYIHD